MAARVVIVICSTKKKKKIESHVFAVVSITANAALPLLLKQNKHMHPYRHSIRTSHICNAYVRYVWRPYDHKNSKNK